jgi:hypothetical protein
LCGHGCRENARVAAKENICGFLALLFGRNNASATHTSAICCTCFDWKSKFADIRWSTRPPPNFGVADASSSGGTGGGTAEAVVGVGGGTIADGTDVEEGGRGALRGISVAEETGSC